MGGASAELTDAAEVAKAAEGAEATGDSKLVTTVSSWPMWILGLVVMIDQVDQNILRGIETPLKADPHLHITDFTFGLLLASFVAVNGLVTVPAGYLADRWHRTRTVGHTIVAWSGITALTAASPTFPVMLGIRSALGFGQAVSEPSCASLLADYYPLEQRGRAFSIQQCLVFLGFGLGIGLGGFVGNTFGWRWAFLLVPGVLIAVAVYRLREPRRGAGDRLHLGITDEDEDHPPEGQPLFDNGLGGFLADMARGLVADLRTIWAIPTMRYALVGISSLLFSVTAEAAALPQFYERSLHVDKAAAPIYVGAMLILGGIPGVLLGGRVADRYANRIRGARMAIPAYCILVGQAVFVASYLRLPLGPAFALQALGAFVITLAIPSLRAGYSDALPANLRGAGFGAFNIVSVIMGQAAASVIVFSLASIFGHNLRTALLLISPPVFAGGLVFLRARDHLDEDAGKIFQAILTAMEEQRAREQKG
ncbi:MAG TPA: MFS transporter [Acidimicrobiales bacterium]|nr:MFS transporter [Acidimicrobiales bacterium]